VLGVAETPCESQVRRLDSRVLLGSRGLACAPVESHATGNIPLPGQGSMLFSLPLMARNLRRTLFAAVVMLASAASHSVQAELGYHVAASASVGASDNPRALPDQSTIKADGFVTAEGHLELNHIGRVTEEHLTYGIMGTTWFRGTEGSGQTHTLRLSSQFQVGPEGRLTLFAGGMLAKMSMIDAAAPNDSQTSGPRPAGDQTFVVIDAGETLASPIGGSWRVDQDLDGSLYRPLGSQSGTIENKSATLHADLNHTWARDWAGLRTRLGAVTSSGSSAQAGQATPVNFSGEFAELTLSWQHDWTPDFRHVVAAGAVVLWTDSAHLSPAGLASLLWHRTGYEIELRATSSADANVLLGAALKRDLVGLRGTLPIDRLELLRVNVAADLEHDSTEGAPAGTGGSANVLYVHGGIQWRPGDMFVFSLDYSFRDQRASANAANSSANGTAGASPFFTFRRQAVMLTVGMQYPPTQALR